MADQEKGDVKEEVAADSSASGSQDKKKPGSAEGSKERPPKKKPVKEKPVKEKPVKEKPVKEKRSKEKKVKEKPVKEKKFRDKPDKENPSKEKPSKEKPSKEKPSKEKKVKKSKEKASKDDKASKDKEKDDKKDKEKKGERKPFSCKKSKHPNLAQISDSVGNNCCACTGLVGSYLKETIRLFSSFAKCQPVTDTQFQEMFCEMMSVLACMCRDCCLMLQYFFRLLFVS